MYVLEQLQQKSLKELKEIGWQLNVMPEADKRCRQNWINALVGLNPPLLQLLENSPAASVEQVEEPIMETVDASPGVELEPVQEPPLESPVAALECPFCGAVHALYTDKDCLDKPLIRCLHCHYCRIKNYPGPIRFEAQEPIRETVETFPGVEFDPLLGAIVPAAKISLDAESDQHSILTGITLSDRFLAHYSPPQAQIIHFQSDADGQLSLLNFEIEFASEPPDPDDFESLDAFREAIARWDWEHPNSFDHFSVFEGVTEFNRNNFSVFERVTECNRNNFSGFERVHEPNFVQNESPLEVSLDSFCLWAPCPYDWYEPHTLLEPSKVLELSLARKSSSTSDFFIPTFDRKGDRPYKSNEPPDTGGYARLPK